MSATGTSAGCEQRIGSPGRQSNDTNVPYFASVDRELIGEVSCGDLHAKMTSPNGLLVYNQMLGNFPLVTFEYDVHLVDISVTTTREVYVLLRRCKDNYYLLVNLEDVFLKPPLVLGPQQTVLVGSSIFVIDRGCLWESGLDQINWVFLKSVDEEDILVSGVNVGPWACIPDHRYALVNNGSVKFDDGQVVSHEEPVKGIAMLCGGLVTWSENSIFIQGKRVCDAPAGMTLLYVRGENVYAFVNGKSLIFNQDAISHYRKPRISFCF